MPETEKTTVAVVGIDIGKSAFHIVGLSQRGAIVLRQRWSRGQVESRFANMPPCLIGMEACVGAHHLSRRLKALGHDARLMPAKYVRPYSRGQKNDFRDAEAIAEAVQRPTMKFVATKTAEQLDLQALHRVRERLVSQRTGTINQIRAFLLERGVAVRQGLRFLRAELPRVLAMLCNALSPRMVRVLEDLACDWRRLDERPQTTCGRRFSNGPVWVEQLAARLEVALRPTQAGGLNFAVGGARLDPLSGPHSLRAQADLFLKMRQPSGRTLHIVYGGGHDLLSAVGHLKAPRMVETAVASLRSIVADLVGHGASDLLVPNLPDVGMTPKIRARGTTAVAHAGWLTQRFNGAADRALSELAGSFGTMRL